MKSRARKKLITARTVVLALAAVLLGLGIYSVNAERVGGNPLPMPLGFGCSVVLSGSMEPELAVNDLVFIKETQQIAPGDVVVFQDDGSLTIHRVLTVDGETVVTKGDANNTADDPIHISQVKGVLVGKLPFMGALVLLFKQPVVVVLVLLGALLLAEMSFRRDKQEDDEDLDEIRRQIKGLMQEMQDDVPVKEETKEEETKENEDLKE